MTPWTPGRDRTRSSSASKKMAGFAARAPCSRNEAVSLSRVVNPGFEGRSVRKVRIISAAPTSSVSDRASCTTTRTRRVLIPAGVAVLKDTRKSSTSDGELACSAGTTPTSNPAASETANVAASTRASTSMSFR